MNTFWHDIAQLVDGKRCLVRNDCLGNTPLVATPQGPADQVLAFAGREVSEAKDTTVDGEPVASATMVMLLPVCVACLSGLGCAEVSALGSCDAVKRLGILLRIPPCLQTPYMECKEFTLSTPLCQCLARGWRTWGPRCSLALGPLYAQRIDSGTFP